MSDITDLLKVSKRVIWVPSVGLDCWKGVWSQAEETEWTDKIIQQVEVDFKSSSNKERTDPRLPDISADSSLF